MKLKTGLRLGRVSNLPTVCTNAVAGAAIAGAAITGGAVPAGALAAAIAAAMLAYTGGMYLNDAFDADFDAANQRFRPIPAGEVSRRSVYAIGFAMVGLSIVVLGLAGLVAGTGLWAAGAGVLLAAIVVFYNAHHKENPLGPLLMGLCRGLVYIAAALVVTVALPLELWVAVLLLLAHVMGLTFIAKREGKASLAEIWPLALLALPVLAGLVLGVQKPSVLPFVAALALADVVAVFWVRRKGPGDVGRAIPFLIAAICLLDAGLIAAVDQWLLACLALAGFPLTLLAHRWVRGT